jgi:3-(3-hydroxy-phenyl)propionate hydroxylase
LLGPWFTVLVFGDALPAGVEDDDGLLRWTAVGPLCDERGRAALAHQLGQTLDGQAWLLRPDQHVMAAATPETRDPQAVQAWISAALDAPVACPESLPEARGLYRSTGGASHAAIPATA